MSELTRQTERAVRAIVAAVRRRLAERGTPVLVVFDGPSGAGKSTLAARVATAVGGNVVPADDFFAAEITAAEWNAWQPSRRADAALDWRRLRRDALEPLLAGQTARWYTFDFAAGQRTDGTYPMCATPVERQPAAVVVLDGAYTARPELADLVDLTVLVTAPPGVRRARLAAREEAAFLAEWHARWDEPEAYYFTRVRPSESFDIIVVTAPGELAEGEA